MFIILLLSGIFGIIWLRSGITALEYSISELENKKLDGLKDAKSLLAERASAMAMQRVEKMAVRDLGLVLADRTRVVYVREGNAGPSRASLETRYGKSYEGMDSTEGSTVGSGRLDREVRVAGDSRDGGYQ